MLLLIVLAALFGPQASCTNDEGENDIDIITPTDDQPEGIFVEETESKDD